MDVRNFTFKATSSVAQALAGRNIFIPVDLNSIQPGFTLQPGMGVIFNKSRNGVIVDILSSQNSTVIEVRPIQDNDGWRIGPVTEGEELTARRDFHNDSHWEGVAPEDRA